MRAATRLLILRMGLLLHWNALGSLFRSRGQRPAGDRPFMRPALLMLLSSALILLGCSEEDKHANLEISGFVKLLQDNGIEGTLGIDTPSNKDIQYVANYVISKYTSTRVISFFKCTSVETAKRYLQDALKNPKMSGQARNGTILIAATFYPPDEKAVEKIKELFLSFKFE